jgi:hypothetical protein
MNLEVEIQRADMYRPAAWYIQFELLQTTFPLERRIKSKRRTDLCISGAPAFETRVFLFEAASLASRIELKVGAVEILADTIEKAHHIDQQANVSATIVQGLYALVFTQKMLSVLRDGSPFSIDCVLRHPKTNQEVGHIQLKLMLEFTGREEQIIEDDRLVQKVEFDEYERNAYVIKEKLDRVVEYLRAKEPEVESWIKQVDEVRNALRSLGADLAVLRKEKDTLQSENDSLHKQITKRQQIEELPVLIDMLSTPFGEGILRQKLVALQLRYEYERRRYEDLKTDWMRIEGKQAKARELQNKVKIVEEAERQSKFHLKRARDMLPAAWAAQEMVQSQNHLITALEAKVTEAIIKPDPAVAAQLADLKFESSTLKEKYRQVQLTLELNNGLLPLEMLREIQSGDEEENREELFQLRSRGHALLQQVQELGEKLSRSVVREARGGTRDEVLALEVQLQAAHVRVMTMQDEMDAQATRHAREVAKLAAELAVLEARIQHKDGI